MRIRCKTNQGNYVIKGLENSATLQQLRSKIEECSGLDQTQLEIRYGFPPKLISSADDGSVTLTEIGIKDADALNVSIAAAAAQPAREHPAGEQPTSTTSNSNAVVQTPIAQQHVSGHQGGNTTSIALNDGTELVRRVIVSDNSCLFNAVGYVMEHKRDAAPFLRGVVAKAVSQDPETYNEVLLEKTNQEYCKWIMDPNHWGGAIELSILSKYYGREICAYDIQTKRCDVYGQGLEGYTEKVMLVYDGLHYDALAVSAFQGAPEDYDITIFDLSSQSLVEIERGSLQLIARMHDAKQFTDTANFTLRCVVCQTGLRGEKEAQQHAKATGHVNFSEY